MLRLEFDPLDVPRDQFVIAFDAWKQARAGKADPNVFGIMDMKGLWFIAGNVLRDLAALNNMEMLPWDVWGAMPQPGRLGAGAVRIRNGCVVSAPAAPAVAITGATPTVQSISAHSGAPASARLPPPRFDDTFSSRDIPTSATRSSNPA